MLRINQLLESGWNAVEVVTDHGFLLLPDAMTKAELPSHLVERRKGRCARLGDNDDLGYPVIRWHWDPSVKWAVAPGISCFEAGKRYEHGGLSLSECVVPRLTVTRDRTRRPVQMERPSWRGIASPLHSKERLRASISEPSRATPEAACSTSRSLPMTARQRQSSRTRTPRAWRRLSWRSTQTEASWGR